jgi:hypothetical protein
MNKCLRCPRHDHTTKSCSLPRICLRCAKEHTMENGCPNEVSCANCGGDHFFGNSACLIVHEKRRLLLDNTKKQRANLLIQVDIQRHRNGPPQNGAFEETYNQRSSNSPSRIRKHSERVYAQAVQMPASHEQLQSVDFKLASFMQMVERWLDQFFSHLSC